MKKLLIIIAVATMFGSCKKEQVEETMCVTCTEKNSLQQLNYCGTPASITAYQNSLNQLGGTYGQVWVCK